MPTALTRVEIASGAVWGGSTRDAADGSIPFAAAPRIPASESSPAVALEQALLRALLRPPCLISFSGGKDSSFLLALALEVASREGLAPPIPVTWRFTNAPRADESQWQDEIIRALGVTEWQVMTAGDDLDVIAPLAQRLLRLYGVRYPANLHLHLPIVEAATGGSVITGLGGDQVLTSWYRSPPTGRPAAARVRQVVPSWFRAPARPRQALSERPWLLPRVARAVHKQVRKDLMSQPATPAERLAWRVTRRNLLLAQASCASMAAAHDVEIHHPLLNKEFHGSLSGCIPSSVSLTRSELIARIVHRPIPPIVYRRRTKAWFGEVFVAGHSRDFASRWDGWGADEDLVDVQALRRQWSSSPLPNATSLLIQHLWLQHDLASHRVSP